jgi:Tfp pilus assembly protein PilX
MMNQGRRESGASLIGVVIALVVLCLLIIVGTRMYMGERQGLDRETAKAVEESGIQSRGGRGVLEAAREQIADHERLIQSTGKLVEEAR